MPWERGLVPREIRVSSYANQEHPWTAEARESSPNARHQWTFATEGGREAFLTAAAPPKTAVIGF